MSFRLERSEAARHADLARRLELAEAAVRSHFAELLSRLRALTEPVNAAIRQRNAVAEEAARFAEAVRERLNDEWDERSERWRDGDAGQAAQAFIDEWDAENICEMQEVRIVEPEIDGDEAAGAFGELPHEPS